MKQKLLLQRAAALCAALTLSSLAASAFAQEKNPDRNAYFGEEHIHTSWSVDAWLFGNRITGPDEALKYAQGQTIKHPLGYDIKIDTPMDFMGVTDHSEYVGRHQGGQHARVGGEQDAGGAGSDYARPKQSGRSKRPSCISSRSPAVRLSRPS